MSMAIQRQTKQDVVVKRDSDSGSYKQEPPG